MFDLPGFGLVYHSHDDDQDDDDDAVSKGEFFMGWATRPGWPAGGQLASSLPLTFRGCYNAHIQTYVYTCNIYTYKRIQKTQTTYTDKDTDRWAAWKLPLTFRSHNAHMYTSAYKRHRQRQRNTQTYRRRHRHSYRHGDMWVANTGMPVQQLQSAKVRRT